MNGDIMLLARLYKSNTEEAIEWIRNHPNDKSADITSKVKKIYYGYGGRGACSSEYDIKIESDGIYICNGEGAETNKYTYSSIVKELKAYMESESCDQLEAKQDKQPPSERIEEVSTTFNYAVLSAELGDYLRHKEEQLKNEYMNFTANCGRIFAEAQDRLAKHGFGENNGVFEKWIASMGFKRDTVYRMINVYNFRSSQIATNEQAQLFDGLSKSLQYEIAKPSAPPELVEQVMSGDITTHKEYIELKKKLERTEDDLRNVERNFDEREKMRIEQGKELFKLRAQAKDFEKQITDAEERAQYAESRLESKSETITNLSAMNATLEKRVKELESRPIDVAAPDEEEIERMAAQMSRSLLNAKDKECDRRLQQMQAESRDKDAEISKLQQRIKENTEDVDMIRNTFMELCMYARTAFKACARFITNNNYSETTLAKLRCDAEGTIDTMMDIINDIRGVTDEEDI